MRLPFFCWTKLALNVCLISLVGAIHAGESRGNSFGINFSGPANDGGWGPHYVNQVGAHGSGPYVSAFNVAAADWYEPGSISQTVQLSGSPSSVNFQSASMGTGSVNIAWESAHPDTGPQDGYTFIPYGFANANRFVMQLDEFGDPILDQDGHYIPVDPVELAPDNGIPPSGEYAVLSGALFATDGIEYEDFGWTQQRDIVVTITGLSSIASGYTVKLLAAAQNGDVVEAFTSATIMDNASNSDTADFVLLPDRPSYWSPYDPDPNNQFVSVAGEAASTTTFTGDSLEIRLSGANEYFNDAFELARTILAGVIINYDSIVTPGLDGDFNFDNKVDAADFVVWRKTLGDVPNYNLWREHFGESSSAAGQSQVTPEPTAGVLCLLATVPLLVIRSVRRRTS